MTIINMNQIAMQYLSEPQTMIINQGMSEKFLNSHMTISSTSAVRGNSLLHSFPSPAALEKLKCFEDQSQLISKSEGCNRNVWSVDSGDISTPLTSSSLLGEGGFASVYQVYIDDKKYALKCLSFDNRNSENELVFAAASLAWEVNLLSKLNHENIICLRGVSSCSLSDSYSSLTPECTNRLGYFFLMDVLEETLFDRLETWRDEEISGFKKFRFLRRRKRNVKDIHQRMSSAVLGIVKGMEYLHKHKIVFGDLKPENIGFDSATGTVKLFDFGLARLSKATNERINLKERKSSDSCDGGSFPYMAPESLQGLNTRDLPSDVYSFGIILWEICALRQHTITCPSMSYDREQYIRRVVDKRFRPPISAVSCKATRRLIQSCWDPCPDMRPSFTRIWCMLTDIIGKKEHSEFSYQVNQPIEVKLSSYPSFGTNSGSHRERYFPDRRSSSKGEKCSLEASRSSLGAETIDASLSDYDCDVADEI